MPARPPRARGERRSTRHRMTSHLGAAADGHAWQANRTMKGWDHRQGHNGDASADGPRQELEANGRPPPDPPAQNAGEAPPTGNNRRCQANADPQAHPAPNLLSRTPDPHGGRVDQRRGWPDLSRAGP
jgi:hypothetical protein